MHAVAARTDRDLLPTAVAALLDATTNAAPTAPTAWRQHTAQNRARDAAYQRIDRHHTTSRPTPTQPHRRPKLWARALELEPTRSKRVASGI